MFTNQVPYTFSYRIGPTPNTSQLDLGRVSSVATNQACVDVEQIIVPYLGMILLNCFCKMFKIVQFYCYSFHTVIGRVVKVWWTIAVCQ